MKTTIKTMLASGLLLLALFINASSFAQVPQKFNYQGIARDAKGNPISKQALGLKISVLPTADATTPEYTETQSILTNEFGLYTLQIGNGTVLSGDMKTVKWETGNKYIQVAIDPQGGTDYTVVGTTQLLSVPYAIYADKAGQAKETVGSSNGTRAAALNNYIEKTSSAGVHNEQSLLYDNGTNIGLGTISPQANFHIADPATNAGTTELRIQHPNLTNNAARLSFFNDASTTFTPTADYAVLNKYAKNKTGLYCPGYQNGDLFVYGNSQGNLMLTSGGKRNASNVLVDGLIGFGRFDQGGSTNTTFMNIDLKNENVGIGPNHVTPLSSSRLDVTGNGKATGIHATADQQSVGQTQSAITGILGLISPFTEAIAVFGEAKASGAFPNGNNVGVAGSAMSSASPQNNIGIMGEAGNAPGYNTAVAGTIVQGANPYYENSAIRGYAPLTFNSYAGLFEGKVKIKDGSQANNFVLTSDPNGIATWTDPCTLPCVAAASANEWHLNGNAVGAVGKFIGTTDAFDLNFKVNNQKAGIIQEDVSKANTAIGSKSQNVTTGAGNSSLGFYSLLFNTTGSNNVAFGWHSLLTNTTGSMNTALGTDVMPFNNASANTSVGFQSAYNNTTGSDLTVVGTKALFENTTGMGNTAIGKEALTTNVTGNYNTAIGTEALRANIIGTANTAVGHKSLLNNNNYENTALGFQTMMSSTSTGRSTAIGNNALELNVSGDGNSALGHGAMQNLLTGDNNTAIGMQAMQFATGGHSNTGIGGNALIINTTGINNTATGVSALGSNTSGSWNTSSGMYSLAANTIGGGNVATGENALQQNTTGDANTGIGGGALSVNTIGTNNTALGADANVVATNLNYATAIGAGALVNQSNTVVLGRTTTSVVDKVGINTTAPHSALQVVGSFATNIKQVSANTIAGIDDYTFLCTNSLTITLPNPLNVKGRMYVIKRNSASASVTITASVGTVDEPIGFNALSSVILSGTTVSVTYQSDGLKWHKIATAN